MRTWIILFDILLCLPFTLIYSYENDHNATSTRADDGEFQPFLEEEAGLPMVADVVGARFKRRKQHLYFTMPYFGPVLVGIYDYYFSDIMQKQMASKQLRVSDE